MHLPVLKFTSGTAKPFSPGNISKSTAHHSMANINNPFREVLQKFQDFMHNGSDVCTHKEDRRINEQLLSYECCHIMISPIVLVKPRC